MYISTICIQVLEFLATAIRQEKEIKAKQIGKTKQNKKLFYLQMIWFSLKDLRFSKKKFEKQQQPPNDSLF